MTVSTIFSLSITWSTMALIWNVTVSRQGTSLHPYHWAKCRNRTNNGYLQQVQVSCRTLSQCGFPCRAWHCRRSFWIEAVLPTTADVNEKRNSYFCSLFVRQWKFDVGLRFSLVHVGLLVTFVCMCPENAQEVASGCESGLNLIGLRCFKG